jgi:uncharacterized phage protein (TIGR01671 family)
MKQREILFRGVSIETEMFVYGSFISKCNDEGKSCVAIKETTYNVNNGKCDLIPEIVKPETVGQFTGLLDKNKVKIFEGSDIRIKHPHENREFKGKVEWMEYGWGVKGFSFSHFDNPSDIFCEGTEYIEVIDNQK